MVRRLVAVTLALALAPAASCKKDSSKGLPPASDWGSSGGQGAAPASPQDNPHAGGNPHAGVDMGGNPHAGDNPHAGVDMSGGGNPHAGDNPHAGVDMSGGPAPEKTAPRTLEKLPDGRFALGPFSVALPAGWTEKPITSSMRAADLVLPAAAPGAEAELIVYYFGESGAGSVQANLDRWLDQIQQPNGKPSKEVAKIEKAKFAGQEGTIVSVSGRYVATMMPGGGEAVDKADQTLVAAIVESPKGPYYFKLVGAKKTVDANAAKLRAMLASLKLR
jgi:hypothetical protein